MTSALYDHWLKIRCSQMVWFIETLNNVGTKYKEIISILRQNIIKCYSMNATLEINKKLTHIISVITVI